jgi:UV DNA damage endonuclease
VTFASKNQSTPYRPAVDQSSQVGLEDVLVRPALGLVCITHSDDVRYRTITRTRYLALPDDQVRFQTLEGLYLSNLEVVFKAITYCSERGIRLYRLPSGLFPMSDLSDGIGEEVLNQLTLRLSAVGVAAERAGVRLTVHPEQYVVLNSESAAVARASAAMLEHQGRIFDRLGLPRSAWAVMNIHCGKSGRSQELIRAIEQLGDSARSRLTLENDERSYGAEATLAICRAANVPMVFDLHHHVVLEQISIRDRSIPRLIERSASTWSPKAWQLVHVSSGRDGPDDPRHHDFITALPLGLGRAPWVEVEAKAKENAIDQLRMDLEAERAMIG